jgi:hypothetical protein
MRSSLYLFLAVFLVVPFVALAQGTPAAVDTSGSLFEINKPLRDELGLFPQYRFFQRALLFRRADSTYYFDVIFKAEEGPQIERVPESAAELVSLRQMVSRASGKLQRDSIQEEHTDGRSRIAAEAAVLSSFVYGPVAISEIGMDHPLAVIGTDVAAGACIYAATVLLLPDDGSVTNGVASARTRSIGHRVQSCRSWGLVLAITKRRLWRRTLRSVALRWLLRVGHRVAHLLLDPTGSGLEQDRRVVTGNECRGLCDGRTPRSRQPIHSWSGNHCDDGGNARNAGGRIIGGDRVQFQQ